MRSSVTLAKLGECRLLARLLPGLPARPDVRVGPGDDCAVIRVGPGARFDWLMTSDPVIEGVHFESSAPAAAVGHKALARCLSDVAAMGGEPLWGVVDLVAPGSTPAARIRGLYRGLNRLAARHGMAVVGGDLSVGLALELHVFVVGRVPAGRAILRRGARVGDALYVTGALGGSRRGRHLAFAPRLAEGQWLLKGRWATAMMDVSDGLALDLPRLLERSECGAEIWLDKLPVHPDATRLGDKRSPLERALSDGEDFELLFTVPPERAAAFETAWRRQFRLRVTRIGQILARALGLIGRDAEGRRRRLPRGGYEHFHAG